MKDSNLSQKFHVWYSAGRWLSPLFLATSLACSNASGDGSTTSTGDSATGSVGATGSGGLGSGTTGSSTTGSAVSGGAVTASGTGGASSSGGTTGCSAGFISCNGVCVNPMMDANHCGGCGTPCGTDQSCVQGVCQCAGGACQCSAGMTECSGACVDTMTSDAHCGVCNNACSGGKTCNNGSCTCPGATCPDGSCDTGSCSCPTGKTFCEASGGCVDTESDASNCGTCGNQCAGDQICQTGLCSAASCTEDDRTFNGHITFYDLGSNTPACHYPPSSLPQYYGAMNEQDYAASGVCGACVEITNTQNGSKLPVQIVDECPCAPPNEQWCCDAQSNHHIDLNQPAYSALGANNNPQISWRYIPCDTNDSFVYYFDPAAKAGYLAVTIMNHRYPIKRVTADGEDLTRQDYNVWESVSLGGGPFTFTVTDIYDRVYQDVDVPLSPGQMVPGGHQFAACE